MLNIITGIFVETAIHSAQNDREEVIQEQIHYEESTLQKLKRFFEDADKDKSGTLTAAEFEALLKDRFVRAHLAALGVEVSEAEGIFKLLDIDASGSVSIEEFVFGCMRMKGGAKAIDLAALMYENKRIITKLMSFFTFVEFQFETQRSHQDKLTDSLNAAMSRSTSFLRQETSQMKMQGLASRQVKDEPSLREI